MTKIPTRAHKSLGKTPKEALMPRLNVTAALAAGTLGMLAPVAAHAHFILSAPMNWMTTTNDGTPQKMGPCGNEAQAGTSATGVVTNVQAGQKVTVTVTATVTHTGWWRIALKEGASSTQTQQSIPDPQATTCTPPIMANPVWSTTQPVLADGLGLPAGSTTGVAQSGTQTYQVTIPATASCTTAKPCALQVIMVMNDHLTPANNCYYHHCADITVGGAGTTGAGGSSGGSGGGPDAGARDGSAAGSGGTTGSGGASATTGAGGSSATTGAGGSSATTGAGGSSATTGEGGTTGTGGKNDSGGGGCTVSGRSTLSLSWGALALGLALLARRRRRRS
jgi:MYXO-CTERM domain-containing protein